MEFNNGPHKGQRSQEQTVQLKVGQFRRLANGMVAILKGCVVSCEAFVKYGKCFPHWCWDLFYMILRIIVNHMIFP